jgi:hypothetical protein
MRGFLFLGMSFQIASSFSLTAGRAIRYCIFYAALHKKDAAAIPHATD